MKSMLGKREYSKTFPEPDESPSFRLTGMSAYYENRHTFDPARLVLWQTICRYLQRYIPENSSILDLGAGYGDFLRHVQAREKFGLEWHEPLTRQWPQDVRVFIQSALQPLPLNAGTLDVVFASNFLEHFRIEEAQSILAEARRILKPGGLLMVVQPNFGLQPGRYFDDFTHKTPFTDVSFCDFLRTLGWRIRRCERRFLPFTMKTHFPKWGWLVRLYLSLPFRPFAGQFLVIAGKTIDA